VNVELWHQSEIVVRKRHRVSLRKRPEHPLGLVAMAKGSLHGSRHSARPTRHRMENDRRCLHGRWLGPV
jgi:hypothetical protein